MSRSQTRQRRPISPRAVAICTVLVVIPTPPFWLPTAITRVGRLPCSAKTALLGVIAITRCSGSSISWISYWSQIAFTRCGDHYSILIVWAYHLERSSAKIFHSMPVETIVLSLGESDPRHVLSLGKNGRRHVLSLGEARAFARSSTG